MNIHLLFHGKGIVSLEAFDALRLIDTPGGQAKLLIGTRTVVTRIESKGEAVEEPATHDTVLAVYDTPPDDFADGGYDELNDLFTMLAQGERGFRMEYGKMPEAKLMAEIGLPAKGRLPDVPRKTFCVALRMGDTSAAKLRELAGQRIARVEFSGEFVGLYTE